MLISDARLTYSEIGEEVGLTRVAVKNRVKALEEKGYAYNVDGDVYSLVVEAYTGVVIKAEFNGEAIEGLVATAA